MKKFLLALVFLPLVAPCFSQVLRIAVYQYGDNPRIKNLQPFADHLQQRFGVSAAVTSYPTVHQLIRGMQTGEVDLAFISTFGYLLLQADTSKHPMQPVAALAVPNAKDNYKTVFVARREAVVKRMEDLKPLGAQLRLALVASGSTSGNLVPRLLLNGAGIKNAEAHFASVRYAGTHDRALTLLLTDSADVAAMGSTEWEKLDSMQRSRLRLLMLSTEIPLGPVLLNRTVKLATATRIRQALLEIHRSDTAVLAAIKSAWSEARQATHFIAIKAVYYQPFLRQFGNERETGNIIRQHVQ